ncbi:MAG: hypothetical protein WC604_04785 [Candidatus Gracilibacteria bacterium]
MLKRLKARLRSRKAKKAEKLLQKALKKEAKRLSSYRGETAYDKGIITWTSPEYLKHRKGWVWYVIFLAIFLGGTYLAYIYDAWTFAVALAVFAIVYLILDKSHPRKIKIVLSDIGIKVGNKVYQYNRIKAFWIVYNPPFHQTLNIKVYNEFVEEIAIQLGGQDPNEVYTVLSKRLPELEGKEPGLLENLSKILKL